MEEEIATPPLASRIASLVHTHFDALPARSKPIVCPDGSREWIPMSGIVIVKGENTSSEKLTCVAVTTGAKCLSASQVPKCRGLVLHDCHAEILAIRAFNYWLLNECHGFLAQEEQLRQRHAEYASNEKIKSPYVHRRASRNYDTGDPKPWPPLELCPDIKIYMYCTCAPCGDASMELCMAAQEDATPWEVPTPKLSENSESDQGSQAATSLLDGRAHFSLLGVVRRKPSRMDAESTRSKSCSDKLALRQVSSLLSCVIALLVAPTRNAYLEGVILPEEEISRVGCQRSFSETGRMKALKGRFWSENQSIDADNDDDDDEDPDRRKYGYRFYPFKVLSVPTEQIESLWSFAKPKLSPLPSPSQGEPMGNTQTPPKKSKPGRVSAIWTLAPSFSPDTLPPPSSVLLGNNGCKALPVLQGSITGLHETIINGVRQGNKASAPSVRGASGLSRAKLWGLLRDILVLQDPRLSDTMVGCESQGRVTRNEHNSLQEGSFLQQVLETQTYEELKRAPQTRWIQAREKAIQDAKHVLKGWIPNSGDESWGLDALIDSKRGSERCDFE